MTRKTLTILLSVAAVLGVVTVLLVSSLGGSSKSASHQMPNGSTMTDGQTTHTMTDGSQMDGMSMP